MIGHRPGLGFVAVAYSPYDYTDAPLPEPIPLIPQDTIATVSMHIRIPASGGVGEDGMYQRNDDGTCEGLNIEFTVLDGQYKGRKFWKNFLLLKGTTDEQRRMADSNRIFILKAILDSSLGLDPNDKSEEARKARTITTRQFQGRNFLAKIGIEKGGPNKRDGGFWPDKNCLAGVITKDKQGWHPVEQQPPFEDSGAPPTSAPSSPTGSAPSAPPVARPKWADSQAQS